MQTIDRPLSAPAMCQLCERRVSDPALDGMSYWDDDKSSVLTCKDCFETDLEAMAKDR